MTAEGSGRGGDCEGQRPERGAGLTDAPFSLIVSDSIPVPVLISVPHAGRSYSEQLRAAMRDPDAAPLRLEDRHADALGKAVAAETGAGLLVANAPRALIDLNRAPDDIDWTMVQGVAPRRVPHSAANRRARSGLGLVPRRLPGSGEIWRQRLSPGEIDARIAEVHRPYHRAIATTLDGIRDRWGIALLIDLHSMPPLGRTGPEGEAAEFVIGDRFGASCSPRLAGEALRFLGHAGKRVAHNRPYSGGFALDHHAAPRRGIHALQVEVCRSTYLDPQLDRPSARLQAVSRVLSGLVRALVDELAILSDPSAIRRAAE